MNKEPTSYAKAMKELQGIVEDLQEEVVNIDDLSKKTKRAAELIQWCRSKLRKTDEEIQTLFE